MHWFESTFQSPPPSVGPNGARVLFMKGNVVLRFIAVSCVALCLAAPAQGTEWAKKLFKENSHEFGTVARAAKVEHVFEMTNPFKETVHIASVRASCGCSTPSIVKDTLATWEKGGIHVRYNTRSFTGQKGATITVVIDKPYYAEVQLNVKGYIRSDVVFDPGVVQFEAIDQGSVVTKKVAVNYAGRQDWQILDVQSANTNFEVELDEQRRGGGRVDYQLVVRAKDSMPAGYFHDQLVLVTNDRRSKHVPLRVEGNVIPGVSVSPKSLSLGVLSPGQQVKKTLVVRGKRPFKIKKIHCEDNCFEFKMSEQEKALHLIPVVFTAPAATQVSRNIRIETEDGAMVVCVVTGTVEEAAAAPEETAQASNDAT